MADKYKSFSELAGHETRDKDFRVRSRECPDALVVIAPHGGGIEPGTSELAEAIAGSELSFYAFEGIKTTANRDLHITSTRFDEPEGIALVAASPSVLALHGEDSDGQVVFLGGRDTALGNLLRASLEANGFDVQTHANAYLQGKDSSNICNRGRDGSGVQLELSKGLRLSFFESLSRSGRLVKTERFNQFVAAIRTVLLPA